MTGAFEVSVCVACQLFMLVASSASIWIDCELRFFLRFHVLCNVTCVHIYFGVFAFVPLCACACTGVCLRVRVWWRQECCLTVTKRSYDVARSALTKG